MLRFNTLGLLFPWIILFTINCSDAENDSFKLSLDMRTPIEEGWFNPDNEEVGIRGDASPLNWGTTYPATDPDGDSIFTVSIPIEIPDSTKRVAFKIKIDGTNNPNDGWQKGRNHTFNLNKGMANEYQMTWEDEGIQPPSTITGHVEIIEEFESTPLDSRDLHIYLPPGYTESDHRYPVLYMHDGQNLFDAANIGQEWKVDEAAEKLIADGEIEPVIIVGIGNTQNRIDEYTPTRPHWNFELQRVSAPSSSGKFALYTGTYVSDRSDSLFIKSSNDTLYAMIPDSDFWQALNRVADQSYIVPQAGIKLKFNLADNEPAATIQASKEERGGLGDVYGDLILQKVKPFVDQNYRTKPDAEFTALGGSSLGGLITIYLGLKHPNVFSKLLVVSPSVWWDNQVILRTVQETASPTNQLIWVDVGTLEGGGMVDGAQQLYTELLEKGWRENQLQYIESEGAGHSESAWAVRFPDMLRFIFPAR